MIAGFEVHAAAVRMKMPQAVARDMNRGRIAVAGASADVVVFDPTRIADTATYDQPLSASVGIDAVFVNGRLAYRGGALEVLARAGRMLSRGTAR